MDEWEGKFVIKPIFNNQIHIDLVKFANKFEAAYEIIKKWYLKETDDAVEWKELEPLFMETGGYYYAQSVVGYKYSRAEFYPYTKIFRDSKLFEMVYEERNRFEQFRVQRTSFPPDVLFVQKLC